MGLDKIKVIEDKVKYTVFNDPVHGTISLHPFLVKIINTPQFQRLRNIKQLGGAYFVYPGSCHNRFEHSIGTAHLAGKLVRHLKENQPELGIEDKDILCVEIAGLCHDLGHGPFSHLFDNKFYSAVGVEKIEHEEISYGMLEYLLKDKSNRFDQAVLKFDKNDWTFIKEMITGKPKRKKIGRPSKKEFLYEIISNERNKVDVDKWDYIARDCYQLGMQNGFDHNRFMELMRVCKVKGKRQLCVHKKECFNLYQMFHTRYCLHRRAYQHPVVNAVEEMFTEALVHANEHAIDGMKLSECAKKLSVFMKLDDGIFHTILNSTKKELKKSREILERIMRREIYQTVANEKMGDHQRGREYTEERIKEKIGFQQNLREDLIVKIVKLNYGMKREDPVEQYNFYSKKKPKVADSILKVDISSMLPPVFEEFRLQIFCKDPGKFREAKKVFESWWKKEMPEARKRKSKAEQGTNKRACKGVASLARK
uniref:deoxynucleoside triphosphate triphosphohydrolase SAMHD1-like n=1 Tax=Styela clava TaxID=7725 RepID=UPI00193A4BD0|nr:deoxynucleoside triphosphate triphosphohydrolase SAMHD1-like [Styela clava]